MEKVSFPVGLESRLLPKNEIKKKIVSSHANLMHSIGGGMFSYFDFGINRHRIVLVKGRKIHAN